MKIDDRTAERIIVKKFFFDNDYVSLIVDQFDRRFFEKEVTADLLEAGVEFFKMHGKVPDLGSELGPIFKNKLIEKGAKATYNMEELQEEINVCFKVEFPPTEDFTRSNVIDFIKSKSIYFSIYDNLEIITKKKDVSTCLANFQNILNIGFDSDFGLDYFHDMEKVLADLANPVARLPTFYPQFDALIGGGIPYDDLSLTVFMAQPGLGKSMMLTNLAANMIAHGKFPLIITLEMSEKMYFSRLNAALYNIEMKQTRNSAEKIRVGSKDLKQRFPESELVIKEFGEYTLNSNQLTAYIKKLVQKKKRTPDMILVDYINLMAPNYREKQQSLYEKVGVICRELRCTSRAFKRPVVSATQTNRGGYDNSEVDMGDTSDSAGINQACDFLGAFWQLQGDKEAGKFNMKFLKDRYGGNGADRNIVFQVDYNTLRISDPAFVDTVKPITKATDEVADIMKAG
ncbi:MAG: DnaB-like helicase C-terminal domain-containing protein [Lentisphaerota bacterium]